MKKLKLRKETLRALDGTVLGHAAGGAGIGPWTPVIHTIPVNQCLYTNVNCLIGPTLQGCTTGTECP